MTKLSEKLTKTRPDKTDCDAQRRLIGYITTVSSPAVDLLPVVEQFVELISQLLRLRNIKVAHRLLMKLTPYSRRNLLPGINHSSGDSPLVGVLPLDYDLLSNALSHVASSAIRRDQLSERTNSNRLSTGFRRVTIGLAA